MMLFCLLKTTTDVAKIVPVLYIIIFICNKNMPSSNQNINSIHGKVRDRDNFDFQILIVPPSMFHVPASAVTETPIVKSIIQRKSWNSGI